MGFIPGVSPVGTVGGVLIGVGIVLGAADDDVIRRVIRHRKELEGSEVAVERVPVAGGGAGGVVQHEDAAIVGLEQGVVTEEFQVAGIRMGAGSLSAALIDLHPASGACGVVAVDAGAAFAVEINDAGAERVSGQLKLLAEIQSRVDRRRCCQGGPIAGAGEVVGAEDAVKRLRCRTLVFLRDSGEKCGVPGDVQDGLIGGGRGGGAKGGAVKGDAEEAAVLELDRAQDWLVIADRAQDACPTLDGGVREV